MNCYICFERKNNSVEGKKNKRKLNIFSQYSWYSSSIIINWSPDDFSHPNGNTYTYILFHFSRPMNEDATKTKYFNFLFKQKLVVQFIQCIFYLVVARFICLFSLCNVQNLILCVEDVNRRFESIERREKNGLQMEFK